MTVFLVTTTPMPSLQGDHRRLVVAWDRPLVGGYMCCFGGVKAKIGANGAGSLTCAVELPPEECLLTTIWPLLQFTLIVAHSRLH